MRFLYICSKGLFPFGGSGQAGALGKENSREGASPSNCFKHGPEGKTGVPSILRKGKGPVWEDDRKYPGIKSIPYVEETTGISHARVFARGRVVKSVRGHRRTGSDPLKGGGAIGRPYIAMKKGKFQPFRTRGWK